MELLFDRMGKAIKHLYAFHKVFINPKNFGNQESLDYILYHENFSQFEETLQNLNLNFQLYGEKGRQMILADLLEYILFGRGFYSIRNNKDKSEFIKSVLYFVNLLMSYDTLTISTRLRKKFITALASSISEIREEQFFYELKNFTGKVGLKKGESEAPRYLDKYFDSLLPKTAGGLWHELLVFVFLIRSNVGYVIPLLLTQRLMGFEKYLIPPDFLIIGHDKNLYGVEVGGKKEIQSGFFSIQSNIPTATVDTENSRASDRCPICKRWIQFCPLVIEKYAALDFRIEKAEVKCLEIHSSTNEEELRRLNINFTESEILNGKCPYTKYSRNKTKSQPFSNHPFANGLHYHYRCVLNSLEEKERIMVVKARDVVALKTHYPFYSGLEGILKN